MRPEEWDGISRLCPHFASLHQHDEVDWMENTRVWVRITKLLMTMRWRTERNEDSQEEGREVVLSHIHKSFNDVAVDEVRDRQTVDTLVDHHCGTSRSSKQTSSKGSDDLDTLTKDRRGRSLGG